MATNPDRIARALKESYPQLSEEQCWTLAAQIVDNIDKRIARSGRIELGALLRRLRENAGLTQEAVAIEMEWSPAKMSRIETGEVGLRPNDMKLLLQLYGVTDKKTVERYVEMARQSWGKRQGQK